MHAGYSFNINRQGLPLLLSFCPGDRDIGKSLVPRLVDCHDNSPAVFARRDAKRNTCYSFLEVHILENHLVAVPNSCEVISTSGIDPSGLNRIGSMHAFLMVLQPCVDRW